VTLPTLHVVFNMSAAVDLRKALVLTGRADRVVAFPDNLSFGPINPPDPTIRIAWGKTELGLVGWEELAPMTREFWDAALARDVRRVAWMSRRSAQDNAGFLEFVWRLGDGPCEFVDLTETLVVRRDKDGQATPPFRALSLALLPAYQIIEHKLLDLAQPLTQEGRTVYRATWQKLRSENAALRIVSADLALTSAPISYFDAELLSHVTERWQKVAMVVSKTMMKVWDDPILNVSDLVLASRIRALAAAGRLEAKGDLMRMGFSEIRLPSGADPAVTLAN
jgi:hypothetical protein